MRIHGSTIGRKGKSELTRSPPKQRSGGEYASIATGPEIVQNIAK